MIVSFLLVAMQVVSASGGCEQPDIVCRPPFDGEREPLSAVDHLTVRVITPIGGPIREDRVTVRRSGQRYRVDRQTAHGPTVSHTDLASKLHVVYRRNSAGRYEIVSANRPNPDAPYYRFRRTRTGERDTALGETCDVWGTRRLNAHEVDSTWLTCLTADGIELWTRIQSRFGLRDFSRTISIERRPIASSEVTPPRDMFDPRRWEGIASALRSDPHRHATGYEVRLEQNQHGRQQPVTGLTIRARDAWRFEEETMADGARRWSVRNPAIGFRFWANRLGSGELQNLQIISRSEEASYREPDLGESLGTGERILGEDCTWHRPRSFTSHMREEQCLTADGILLGLRRHYDRGGPAADLRAVNLLRRRPPMRSLLPPPEVLSFRNWSRTFH